MCCLAIKALVAAFFIQSVVASTRRLCEDNEAPSVPHRFLSQFIVHYNNASEISGGSWFHLSSPEECARFCLELAQVKVYPCSAFQFEREGQCFIKDVTCKETSLAPSTSSDYYTIKALNASAQCNTSLSTTTIPQHQETISRITINITAQLPNITWTDDLNTISSFAYKNLSNLIIHSVKQLYINDSKLRDVMCHRFRNSSRRVLVEFSVVFKEDAGMSQYELLYNALHRTKMIDKITIKSISDNVPGKPPENISAVTISSGMATLTWTLREWVVNSAVTIWGHRIIYQLLDDESVINTLVVDNKTQNIELKDLRSFSNYTIRVRSITSKGFGISSSPILLTTQQKVIAPLTINISVHLWNETWSYDLSNRTHYTFISLDTKIKTNVNILYQNSSYFKGVILHSFRREGNSTVTANLGIIFHPNVGMNQLSKLYNALYIRGKLNSLLATPVKDEIPGKPPTNITLSSASPFNLHIRWTPSTSPECGYIVYYRLNTSLHMSNMTVNSTPNDLTISGLQRFSNYNVWMKSITTRGLGIGSETVLGKTLEEVMAINVTLRLNETYVTVNSSKDFEDLCRTIQRNVVMLFTNDTQYRGVTCLDFRNDSKGFFADFEVTFGQEVNMNHFSTFYYALYRDKRIGDMRVQPVTDNCDFSEHNILRLLLSERIAGHFLSKLYSSIQPIQFGYKFHETTSYPNFQGIRVITFVLLGHSTSLTWTTVFSVLFGSIFLPQLNHQELVTRTNKCEKVEYHVVPGKPPKDVSAGPSSTTSIDVSWVGHKYLPIQWRVFYDLLDINNITVRNYSRALSPQVNHTSLRELQKFAAYAIWVRSATHWGLGLSSRVIIVKTLEEVFQVNFTVLLLNETLNITSDEVRFTFLGHRLQNSVNLLFQNDSQLRVVKCNTFRNASRGVLADFDVTFGQEVNMSHFSTFYYALYRDKRIGDMRVQPVTDNLPGKPPTYVSASPSSTTSIDVSWVGHKYLPVQWRVFYDLLDINNITVRNYSRALSPQVNHTSLRELQKFAAYAIWVRSATHWGLGLASRVIIVKTLEEVFPVNVKVYLPREPWKPDLLDTNSTNFRNLSRKIERNILITYSNETLLKEVSCHQFRNASVVNGSVIADIRFIFGQFVQMRYFRILYDAIYRKHLINDVPVIPLYDTIPGKPPSNITAAPTSTTSMALTWNALSGHERLETKRVEVFYQLATGHSNQSILVSANRTSVLVERLEKFRNYSFWIAPVTTIGMGISSDPVFAKTLEELVPLKLTVRFPSLPWSVNLSDVSSEQFRSLSATVEQNIYKLYANETELRKVICHSFRNGSVIANLSIIYGQNVGMQQFAKLYNALYVDGRLFNLTVQPLTDSVPGKPPTNVTVTAMSSTSLQVTWNCSDCHIPNSTVAFLIIYRVNNSNANVTQDVVMNSTTRLANLTGLTKFSTYLVWVASLTVRGNGIAAGPVYDTTFEDVPSLPPSRIQAFNMSSTSIHVTWGTIPPGYVHGVLRGYNVLYRRTQDMNNSWSNITSTLNQSVILVLLEKYTEYDIQVMAFTKVGTGPAGKVTVMTDEDVPSLPPTDIRVRNTSSTSLGVTWELVPSAFTHGIVLGYQVFYRRTDDTDASYAIKTANISTQSIPLTGLNKYTEYRIRLVAFTSKGNGTISNGTNTFTDEDVPSLPPGNVKARNTSSTSLNVTWDRIPASFVHGILKGYRVLYRRESSTNTSYSNVTSRVEHVKITQLAKYTRYTVKVLAYTVKGDGNVSLPLVVSTDEDVPSLPPVNVRAHNTSSTSLFISWDPVPNGYVNGILRGYRVLFKLTSDVSTNGTNTTTVNTTSMAKLDGLEKFSIYRITVLAFTIKGNGPMTANITVSTDEDVPSLPPLNLRAHNTSSTSLQIDWDEVSRGYVHGILRGYRVFSRMAEDSIGGFSNNTTAAATKQLEITGLRKYTEYLIKVLAFTVKGDGEVSHNISVRTNEDVPSLPPRNLVSYNTSSTSLNVTWSEIPTDFVHGILLGYRVLYHTLSRRRKRASHVMTSTVTSPTQFRVQLKGLRKFTKYNIRALGYTRIGDGAISVTFAVTTDEDIPSKPPDNVQAHNTSSTSLRVHWETVPQGYVHGILLGYRVKYKKTVDSSYTIRTKLPWSSSEELTGLEKYTDYNITLLAFTRIGNGVESATITVRTDEDVPSRVPPNARSINKAGSTIIRIHWARLPQEYVHGILRGYKIEYKIITMAEETYKGGVVMNVTAEPGSTMATLVNLESFATYEIKMAAFTVKGLGPWKTFNERTCNCHPVISTNWWEHPPYVKLDPENANQTALHGHVTPVQGIIPPIISAAIQKCCGICTNGHQASILDFKKDGYNADAKKSGLIEVKNYIDGKTFVNFPISGTHMQKKYYSHDGIYEFVSIMETNGAAFIVVDKREIHNEVFLAVLGCWPTVVFVFLAAYVAGIVMWMLDVRYNPSQFPRSFIDGTLEGVWWAFVTMTTVGYGDRIPKSIIARLFALVWTWMGIATIAVLTSTITASLMSMVFKSDLILYGTKVAVIDNSSEYKLGVRRNAILNVDRKYGNIKEIYDDLVNDRIHAALLDSYAAGSEQELFDTKKIRVKEVIKPIFDSSYGAVLGGDAKKLHRCIRNYVKSERSAIYKIVERNVKTIKASKVSPAVRTSSSLLTSKSDLYRLTVTILCSSLGIIVITALIWEYCYRRKKQRKVVSHNETKRSWPVWTSLPPKERYDSVKEELRTELRDFYDTFKRNCNQLRRKHALQIEALRQQKKGVLTFSVNEWMGDRSATYAVTKDSDVNSILDGLDLSMFDKDGSKAYRV